MMATTENMKSLYSELIKVGYNKKYIDSLLPDWWGDDLAATPAGFQQASLILSQTFGIRAETLFTKKSTAFNLPEAIRFKHRENVPEDELKVACAVARSLARIVLKALPDKPRSDFYLDASELRKILLKGKQWVSFKDVLIYCLSIGIPVIHLHYLPAKAKKMDGLAFEQSGRPVIVILPRFHGHPAKRLF